jgi:hypothetical protein
MSAVSNRYLASHRRLTVYLPEALYNSVRLSADHEGRTLSAWVARAAALAVTVKPGKAAGNPKPKPKRRVKS